MCRQLVQLWEVFLGRVESRQVRAEAAARTAKLTPRHVHACVGRHLRTLAVLILFFENWRQAWQLLPVVRLLRVVVHTADLVNVRVVGLRLPTHVKLETVFGRLPHHLGVFGVAELVLLLLLLFCLIQLGLCVVAAFGGVVTHLANDTTDIRVTICLTGKCVEGAYLFDCWLRLSPMRSVRIS